MKTETQTLGGDGSVREGEGQAETQYATETATATAYATPTETVALPVCRCRRCGHSWIARHTRLPKTCPRCHSPYWNQDKLEIFITGCPLCPWKSRFRKMQKATAATISHVRLKHGDQAMRRLLLGSGMSIAEARQAMPRRKAVFAYRRPAKAHCGRCGAASSLSDGICEDCLWQEDAEAVARAYQEAAQDADGAIVGTGVADASQTP